MLVNVITRYPAPPPAVLEHVVFENANGFGGHSIAVTSRSLQPATVHNDQAFGSNAVIFALKSLAPTVAAVLPGQGDQIGGEPFLVGGPRGTLRCVERCCPSAAQARRSEICRRSRI